MHNTLPDYTLPIGSKEQERLIKQRHLYGDADYISRNLLNHGNVLEVGCGSGANLWAAEHVKHYTGIDLFSEQIETASKLAQTMNLSNIDLLQGNASAIPFSDKSFDLVFCRLVLIHQIDPGIILKEMYRVTRNTGRILAIEPNVIAYYSSKPHLNKLFQLRSCYVYSSEKGYIDIADKLVNLFEKHRLKNIVSTEHIIQVNASEPDKLKDLQWNMFLLAQSVQKQLIKLNLISEEECLLAEQEAKTILRGDSIRQVLCIAQGTK